ncbi:neprilysin-3-like [Galendromus occidentalis]|uniref:Neprilysin-3-like n=1 Tax=Galendromus occidentalis TaxID=34638 RepID=A0AAJ7L353_9ACAR|nr:neprilysin-3-like [Galendromus occidentalis]
MGFSRTFSELVAPLIVCAVLSRSEEVCETESCQAIAEGYRLNGSESVEPCDDFFSYVCENWIKSHPWFEGTESLRNVRISTQQRLSEVIEVVLSKRLKNLQKRFPSLRESEVQALKFYTSCVRSQETPNMDMLLTTLRRFFHDVGLDFFDEDLSGTSPTAFSVLLALSIKYGISPIFKVIVDHESITLTRSSPPRADDHATFEHSDMETFWKIQLLEYFVKDDKYDIRIVNLLGSMFNALQIQLDSVSLMRIGRNYFAIKKAIKSLFNIRMLSYDRTLAEWETLSAVPWMNYLNSHMDSAARVQGKHRLKMDSAYFELIVTITTDPQLTTIFKDFIAVHLLISEFGELIGEISHRSFCSFMLSCWDLHKKVEHRCAEKQTIEEMKWTSVAIVSRALHTSYSTFTVRYLFSLLKCVLVEELTKRMDVDITVTRSVLPRILLLRDRVAFPRYLERYETTEYRVSMSQEDFLENIVAVKRARQMKALSVFGDSLHRNEPMLEHTHALYSTIYDDIYLPAYMMQYPYLVEGAPLWHSLAALGWVAAHEIGHAFDLYVLSSPRDSPPQNASDFQRKYAESQQCFAAQFAIPGKRSGFQVLGEAMADNLGYRLVVESFKYLRQKRKLPTLRLHRLTQTQLFYVTLAFVQCYATTAVNMDSLTGVHPPFYHRVNRGLSNIEEFASAFQCRSHHAMVAKPRCSI